MTTDDAKYTFTTKGENVDTVSANDPFEAAVMAARVAPCELEIVAEDGKSITMQIAKDQTAERIDERIRALLDDHERRRGR